jgi:hypothetical protein
MTIGPTTGKEPDHVADEDLMTLDEMRGTMKDIHAAALTNAEKATVRGVMSEMAVVKQRLLETEEQNNRLINLYQTLRGEFEVFRANYVIALNMKIGGGSTTPEDREDGA